MRFAVDTARPFVCTVAASVLVSDVEMAKKDASGTAITFFGIDRADGLIERLVAVDFSAWL